MGLFKGHQYITFFLMIFFLTGFKRVSPHEQHIKALLDGIERLAPPICRGIVLMHYRDGLTFKQIAAHYHVSETTIYKHLRDAMSQLRLTLKQLG